MLLQRQVRQRGCQRGPIVELTDPGIRTFHGSADIDQQMQIHVRFGVELFDVQPLLPGENLPVHMP